MNYAQLLEDIKHEVTVFFQMNDKGIYSYHNLAHTQNVVANVGKIARYYKLDDKDSFIVNAAAWYHDTGYQIGGGRDHEQQGAAMAENFLLARAVDQSIIEAVKNCILATKLPQAPQTLLEQIVCDADLYHLGTEEFSEQNKQVRKEMEHRLGKEISKHEWRLGTIKLFEFHHYHTDYAHIFLDPVKKQNLEKLKSKEAEDEPNKHKKVKKSNHAEVAEQPAPTETKKQKPDRPERGIETMFRITSNNHQRLSDMADNKAHIMITTTSIILSVLLSVMLRKLEDNHHLIIPTILLLAVCVVTMTLSILSTRPSIPPGTFTPQDIADKKVNLLFFGNFYRMNYEEYSDAMQYMMSDREFLYGNLTRDVYSQGVVLGRKYRLLRAGYNVFMFGVIVSVIAYTIAVIFFAH
ncbi:Pycsar system effector family protein [Pinibacter aurantiacus]|uniref:HD domain-containing protein n=1 Tax=Pinibacter aurantiacus TaxID=2851599 RepID=A0A9E2SCU8_9BACT|nr:Pycsar system effector family protein [Pinibacter aurantiacus]MBV4359184.1 HD domain-containing protein [Pinibacter aurantiacus]